jgi:hypothetical protein
LTTWCSNVNHPSNSLVTAESIKAMAFQMSSKKAACKTIIITVNSHHQFKRIQVYLPCCVQKQIACRAPNTRPFQSFPWIQTKGRQLRLKPRNEHSWFPYWHKLLVAYSLRPQD